MPALAPLNSPAFDTMFTLDATNLEPTAVFAFMAIGLDDATSIVGPLPLNLQNFGLGAGCDLLVSADVSTLFGVSGGGGTFDFSIPNDPGFNGFPFYFQCASIDPGATGGLALSNAVEALLGY